MLMASWETHLQASYMNCVCLNHSVMNFQSGFDILVSLCCFLNIFHIKMPVN